MGKQCQTCEFRDHCHAEAEKSDSLYLLDKMTLKIASKYQRKGIFTLTQLSYVHRNIRLDLLIGPNKDDLHPVLLDVTADTWADIQKNR